jgi:hypothetical protein
MNQVKGFHVMRNKIRGVRNLRETRKTDQETNSVIQEFFKGDSEKCLAYMIISLDGSKKNKYFTRSFV